MGLGVDSTLGVRYMVLQLIQVMPLSELPRLLLLLLLLDVEVVTVEVRHRLSGHVLLQGLQMLTCLCLLLLSHRRLRPTLDFSLPQHRGHKVATRWK